MKSRAKRASLSRSLLLGALGVVAALPGCGVATENLGTSEAANTAGKDAWGPALSLRDDTPTWDGRPGAGWYVTPIHASLLPDGRVLLTGWGRAQPDRCAFPEGSRAHGTSFVLDPADLATRAGPGTVSITPLDEVAEQTPGWTKDVLYCAGHVPTSGGVLYTGGARYQDLGVRGHEAEVGLSSARVFDYASGQFRRLGGKMSGGPQAEPIKSRPQFGPQDKRGWRWYPTNTRLPDGTVLVSGGFSSLESANNSVEIFDPATETYTRIGDRNTFREFCTVHRGTTQDKGVTCIGNDNWIMAYVHIAHDCVLANDVICSNNTTLAGHVQVGDHVICSGFSAIHQYCRLGAHSFLGGFAGITRDVPPYVMVAGQPTAPHGINTEGLKRSGFSTE